MEEKRPKVGVAVILVKENMVLCGKRKAHGSGTWGFVGGHLEFGESIEDCARREVREEVGVEIDHISQAAFTNDIFADAGRQYVTLYVTARIMSGEVQLMEPENFEEWQWFSWDKLPKPLFLPVQNLLKQGYTPFS